MDFLCAALVVVAWGGINRLRGWGPLEGTPHYKFWSRVAAFFGRDTCALMLATVSYYWLTYLGMEALIAGIASLSMAAGWRVAVTPGWGEYQDGQVADNHEISWIDRTVRKYSHSTNPMVVGAVSMSLRGAYYVLVWVPLAIAMQSWAPLLGILSFWQTGVLYYLYFKYPIKGDYVMRIEWIDNALRGLWFVLITYWVLK